MKKTLFYLLCFIAVSGVVSCNGGGGDDDGGDIEPPIPLSDFIISGNNPSFTIFGGTSDIVVTGKDGAVVEITLTPSADWFDVQENDGTITVSAPLNETGVHEGTITVSAEGYNDGVISVSQAAPAPVLWDNPSAYYMNLRGGVKSVSYVDYRMRDVTILDAEFNDGGWITSFKDSYGETEVMVIYDDLNRITELATSEGNNMKLSYGTHGQYIFTDDIFFKEMAYSFDVLEYPAWMPLFIKDLTKIELILDGEIEATYEIVNEGDAWMLILDGDTESPVMLFSQSNGFTSESVYGSGFYAAASNLTVNVATGKISRIDIEDAWGAMAYIFGDDHINSLVEVESDFPAEAEYDENLNIVSFYDGYETSLYEYTLDEGGNWATRTVNGESDIEREITYWN